MVRLLSLNLQHGRPGDGARLDPATAPLADSDIADAGAAREVLAALADQIRDIDPDVIALQEVDLGQRRSGRLDQTAVLADLLGWDGHRFAATYAGPVVGLRRRPRRSALTERADDVQHGAELHARPFAALDLTHPLARDARPPGQLGLRQAGGQAMPAERRAQIAESGDAGRNHLVTIS